jgi:arylsulfatase A-like enzyme
MRSSHRTFVRVAVLGTASAALASAQAASTGAAHRRAVRRPNIVLILADDLGYGDLGSYGQKRIRTPHLDRIAREGVRFTQFYAGSPVCAPSRASLMTGLHQGHAPIRGNAGRNGERVPLRTEDLTVAEVLKGAGYRTGAIGKWGLGEPGTSGVPNRQGFDYWFGYLNQRHAHDYYPDRLWRNEEWVEVPNGYSHDLFTAEAVEFVRREREAPFFLYLAYSIPHANNELTRETGNGMEVPDDAPYTHERWSPQQRNYAAMVTRLDRDVGKLLALLAELDLDRDTAVFFTSDNGPQAVSEGGYDAVLFDSNGPLRGLKRDLYEGGIRVPLLVRWPGRLDAGRRIEAAGANWDFLPTAAAIVGVEAPGGIDGVSMLPALLGEDGPQDRPLYWEFSEGGFIQAARRGRWKAIRRGLEGPVELYDLDADVGETRDLFREHPLVVAEMTGLLRREHVESEHWPAVGGVP